MAQMTGPCSFPDRTTGSGHGKGSMVPWLGTETPERAEETMSMVINCAAYQNGCRVADVDLEQAGRVDTGQGRFVWIGLHEPDEALLRTVQQRFGLHDLAIEDAHSAHQRPKLEIYGESLFLVLRTAQLQDHKIRFGESHIFAGRGYVVTIRHGSTTPYTEVRARCEAAPKMLSMGESFVVYSVMDFIVDNYFPIDHALYPYFRDVQDHVIRAVEGIDNLLDLVTSALGANLQLTSLQQNNVIKIFSVAAVVLMPPTLVASIYGMNFKAMPELDWSLGYPAALVLMLTVAVLPYLLFKWMKWL